MKPIFIRLIVFLFPLTLSFTANSQTRVHSLAISKSVLDSAARYLLSSDREAAAESDRATLAKIQASSPRLHYNFTTKFREAYEIGIEIRKNVHFNCLVNGIRNRALYTKSGKFLHNIRYYDLSDLPASVTENVYAGYPAYQLFGGVTEVEGYGNTVYFVLIENKNSWKQLKVSGEIIEVHQEYQKTTDQDLAGNLNR